MSRSRLAAILAQTLFAVWAYVGASTVLQIFAATRKPYEGWGAGPYLLAAMIWGGLLFVCAAPVVFRWTTVRAVTGVVFVALLVGLPSVAALLLNRGADVPLKSLLPFLDGAIPAFLFWLIVLFAVVVTVMATIRGLRGDPATWSGAAPQASTGAARTPMEDLIESVAVDASQAFVIEQALNASLQPAEREKAFAVIVGEPDLLTRVEQTANEIRDGSQLAKQLLDRVRRT